MTRGLEVRRAKHRVNDIEKCGSRLVGLSGIGRIRGNRAETLLRTEKWRGQGQEENASPGVSSFVSWQALTQNIVLTLPITKSMSFPGFIPTCSPLTPCLLAAA
jgi:hypothetical protein